jgi:hypothetical protein
MRAADPICLPRWLESVIPPSGMNRFGNLKNRVAIGILGEVRFTDPGLIASKSWNKSPKHPGAVQFD